MSSPLVEVRGLQVHYAHIVVNVVWDVAVLWTWVVLGLIIHRCRHFSGPHAKAFRQVKVFRIRLIHVVAMNCCLTVAGIDVSHAYFSWAEPINQFSFGEFGIFGGSYVIYFFVSHIEAYYIANNVLTFPRWLPLVRRIWMAVNLVVSHVLQGITFGVGRLYLEGLVFQFMALQFMFLGPFLLHVVRRISRQVEHLYEESPPSNGSRFRKNFKAFKRFGVVTALFVIFFGVALTAHFAPQFARDRSVTFDVVPGFGNRDNVGVYDPRQEWLKWTALLAQILLVAIHWFTSAGKHANSTASGCCGFLLSTTTKSRKRLDHSPALDETGRRKPSIGWTLFDGQSLHSDAAAGRFSPRGSSEQVSLSSIHTASISRSSVSGGLDRGVMYSPTPTLTPIGTRISYSSPQSAAAATPIAMRVLGGESRQSTPVAGAGGGGVGGGLVGNAKHAVDARFVDISPRARRSPTPSFLTSPGVSFSSHAAEPLGPQPNISFSSRAEPFGAQPIILSADAPV